MEIKTKDNPNVSLANIATLQFVGYLAEVGCINGCVTSFVIWLSLLSYQPI